MFNIKTIEVELYRNVVNLTVKDLDSFDTASKFKNYLIENLKSQIYDLFKSFKISDLSIEKFSFYWRRQDNNNDYFEFIEDRLLFDWKELNELRITYNEYEQYLSLKRCKEELDRGNPYEGMYARWRDDDLGHYSIGFCKLGGSERLNQLLEKYEKENP